VILKGFIHRGFRNPVLLLSSVMILLVVLSSILAPLITPYDPSEMNSKVRLSAPSVEHWFGTDQFGRDVFTRVIYGSRLSLQIAITAVFTAVIIGGIIGILSGYYGGWLDAITIRIMDVLIAFPSLLLALFLVAILGPDIKNLILAISLTRIPYFARLVRAEVASLERRPFVEAGRMVGATNFRIMIFHLLPNVFPLILVFATMDIATAVIAESSLSYLGLGAQPPTPSWGRMLTEARGFLGRAAWLSIFPGFFLMVTIISFNLLGDSLRDIVDPRLRRGNK
jgi:peptide/nickel transport system permease protein